MSHRSHSLTALRQGLWGPDLRQSNTATIKMGASGSKADVSGLVQIAQSPVPYNPPLGPPNPVSKDAVMLKNKSEPQPGC